MSHNDETDNRQSSLPPKTLKFNGQLMDSRVKNHFNRPKSLLKARSGTSF